MTWHTNDRVLQFRGRHRTVDIVVEMLDGWRRHLSGRNVNLIGFYGFLSLFPLALAATTVLGFVLEGNEDLQRRVTGGAFEGIPLIGADLTSNPDPGGSVLVLIVGLLAALWSSTQAMAAIHRTQDDVWEIPVDDRARTPSMRCRALLGILILGGAQLGSVTLSGLVGAVSIHAVGVAAIIGVTAVLNVGSTLLIMRFLVSVQAAWGQLWLGAVIAGSILTALHHFSTALARYFTENAESTYGDFAVVLGLVTWLELMAVVSIMSVELNAARARLAERDATRGDERYDLSIASI